MYRGAAKRAWYTFLGIICDGKVLWAVSRLTRMYTKAPSERQRSAKTLLHPTRRRAAYDVEM